MKTIQIGVPVKIPQTAKNLNGHLGSYVRPISPHRNQERHQAPKDYHLMNSTERTGSFLVEQVVELLSPLATRVANQFHANHNPFQAPFFKP